MSDAADKLARTRLAIIAHLQARERHHERRESAFEEEAPAPAVETGRRRHFWNRGEPRAGGARGWLGQGRRVLRTWWRHHPASMGVDLARPVLSSYATRKPVQYVAIAAGIGAALVLLRPWRVVSATGLIVALVKSSQLPSLVMSAMAGVNDEGDGAPPI